MAILGVVKPQTLEIPNIFEQFFWSKPVLTGFKTINLLQIVMNIESLLIYSIKLILYIVAIVHDSKTGIRYLFRSLPNQLGSYLNRKLLAKDYHTPELLRSPLRVVRHSPHYTNLATLGLSWIHWFPVLPESLSKK